MKRVSLALRSLGLGLALVALAACGGSAKPTATSVPAATTAAPAVAATAVPTVAVAVVATAGTEATTTTFTSPVTTFSSPLNFNSPIPTPTFQVYATSGVVFGQITGLPAGWVRATVWLAPFTPVSDDGKTGFYVLEPSVHPYTEMFPNGYFQLTSVPPGKYVIVAGPSPEEALPAKEGGNSKVIEVNAGEVVDAGQFSLP